MTWTEAILYVLVGVVLPLIAQRLGLKLPSLPSRTPSTPTPGPGPDTPKTPGSPASPTPILPSLLDTLLARLAERLIDRRLAPQDLLGVQANVSGPAASPPAPQVAPPDPVHEQELRKLQLVGDLLGKLLDQPAGPGVPVGTQTELPPQPPSFTPPGPAEAFARP